MADVVKNSRLVRNRYGDRRFRSLAAGAFDGEFAAEFVDALLDALKAEMSLEDARGGFGVKSSAVVGDGAEKVVAVDRTGAVQRRAECALRSEDPP